MKHPEPAEWMTWLYGESPTDERLDFEAHLAGCPDCRARVDAWKRTLGILDAVAVSRLETGVASRRWARVRQALAIAALLVAGFLLGRHSGVTERQLQKTLQEFRTVVQQDLASTQQGELQNLTDRAFTALRWESQEWLAALAAQLQQARVNDQNEVLLLIQELDGRRAGEIAEVRSGLSALAGHTGLGFEQTQTQMRLLSANLSDPWPTPNNEPPSQP
jgi:hypothetical protein